MVAHLDFVVDAWTIAYSYSKMLENRLILMKKNMENGKL
jgi:hypothetical protein